MLSVEAYDEFRTLAARAELQRAIALAERDVAEGGTIRLDPPGVYRQLVRGHHRVFYRVEQDVALVLRVWDARREPNAIDITE